MKDWLGFENTRNKRNAGLYERLIKLALAEHGEVQVLIGHHITFEIGGDLETENEIPSADCLMFDHYIMGKIFGARATEIMVKLAQAECMARDVLLASELHALELSRV